MDNTLKVLLGVLGFAGVLTFLATNLNTPNVQETPPVAAVATTPSPPVEPAVDPDTAADEEIVIEDDVTTEDVNSFGEPTIELPGDDEEVQNIANGNTSEFQSEGPPPPPPLAPGI